MLKRVLNYLFSFKGRVNRGKYWRLYLILIVPGILIGGILVAQSMIETAKLQSFCREKVSQGQYQQNCKELSYVYMAAKKTPKADKNISPEQHSLNVCESMKTKDTFRGSCDEYMLFEYELKNKLHPTDSTEAGEERKEGPQIAIIIFGVFIGLFIILPLYIATFAVTAKRLHDRNLSGWWQLIPVISSFIGEIGGGLGILGSIVSLISGLAIFIICGFLKGTPGDNKYGPDPLQK